MCPPERIFSQKHLRKENIRILNGSLLNYRHRLLFSQALFARYNMCNFKVFSGSAQHVFDCGGGGGAKGERVSVSQLGGSGGMLPRNILI